MMESAIKGRGCGLNKWIIPAAIILFAIFLFILAVFQLGNAPKNNWDPAAYLLAVCALAATLAGIGFAVYGYFNVHRAETIIEAKLKAELERFKKELDEENRKMQEAMQKLSAGYNAEFNMKDIDAAIRLYKAAVDIYPAIYNGYTALAYAYQTKGIYVEAKKYFELALKTSGESYQCLNDLARFSAAIGEFTSALSYLERTLEKNPEALTEIESDPAFEPLKAGPNLDEYNRIIHNARSKL
jgi:tetratricopeptide (TPR) repeat protein